MTDLQGQGPADTGPRFRIGEILWESTTVLFNNFVPLGLLILIVTVATYVVGIALVIAVVLSVGGAESVGDPGALQARMTRGGGMPWGPVGAAVVVFVLFSILSFGFTTSVMVSGAMDGLRGNKVSIGRCLANGVRVFLPVSGISVIVWLVGVVLLAIAGALMFLFIGMLALPLVLVLIASVLWVTIPVATVERTGVFASLSRAAELSRGYRWKIYFTVLVVSVLFIVISLIAGGLMTAMSFLGAAALFNLLGFAANLLLMGWGAMTAAVGYYDLRMAKEGIDIDQIAAVFD